MGGTKQRVRVIFAVGLGIGLFGTIVQSTTASATTSSTFKVKSDTFVTQVLSETNRERMYVTRVNGTSGKNKVTLLDFGTLNLTGTVSAAKLTLAVKTPPTVATKIVLSKVGLYDPTTVTFSTAPSLKDQIATTTVGTSATQASFNVTTAIAAGVHRFAISTAASSQVEFVSSEAGNGAKVNVTYATTGGGLNCSNPDHITGNEGGKDYPPYRVNQDVWSGQGQQTMDVCSAANWRANVTESGTPETGVKTYPDSGKYYTNWTNNCSQPPSIKSFSKMNSTFGHTAPGGNNSYDYAYDVFLNASGCNFHEIMIWTQWQNISVPNAQLHPTIDGVAYDIYHNSNNSYIQMRMKTQVSSGNLNLMDIYKYLDSQGLISLNDHLVFEQYGPEVLTTYGQNVPFYLTDFSITDN